MVVVKVALYVLSRKLQVLQITLSYCPYFVLFCWEFINTETPKSSLC